MSGFSENQSPVLGNPIVLAVLLASPVVLLPVGRTSEIPVVIMMALGGWLLWRHHGDLLKQESYRLFTLLFLVIWVPMVTSLPDSIDAGKSWLTTLGYIRFYLAGLFAISIVQIAEVRRLAYWILFATGLFWVADSLLQFSVGADLFGNEYFPGRLNGVFADNYKQGQILAALGPLMVLGLQKELGSKKAMVAVIFLLVVILLSGTRASWIMALVAGAGFIFYSSWRHPGLKFKAFLFIGVMVSIFTVLYTTSNDFRDRVDQALLLFEGDKASVDVAVSYRVAIWEHAYEVLRDHPINGIGVRGFRQIYEQYASDEDFFVTRDMQVTHPHQLILEVGSGAGLIGLAGLSLFYYLLLKSWMRASSTNRNLALGAALGVLAVIFPLNTHLAFYSSFWGLIVWWLLAMYVGLSHISRQDYAQ